MAKQRRPPQRKRVEVIKNKDYPAIVGWKGTIVSSHQTAMMRGANHLVYLDHPFAGDRHIWLRSWHVRELGEQRQFELTQIDKQVRRNRNSCPYCGAVDGSAVTHNDAQTGRQHTIQECRVCDAKWSYDTELVNITEIRIPLAPIDGGLAVYEYDYQIISGATNEVVWTDHVRVKAKCGNDADAAARQKIAEYDPHYDERLNPSIKFTNSRMLDIPLTEFIEEGEDIGHIERTGNQVPPGTPPGTAGSGEPA